MDISNSSRVPRLPHPPICCTAAGKGVLKVGCKAEKTVRSHDATVSHRTRSCWALMLPTNFQIQSNCCLGDWKGTWPINNTHVPPFNGPFPGLPGWAGTRKVKPIWISLKQETVSGSGISWAIRKSAPCSRQTTMPAPHHSVFLQAGCPSCRPTISVKALKARHDP